jgi:FKBP-type peptidyl-prolyl cis-trans isomerase FklB
MQSSSLFIAALLVAAAVAGTNEKGLKFLEENKGKEGVITLASGMQYKVLRKGEGAFHPTVDSPCECHYKGTLIDGTQFDSSYDRGSPTTFAPNQVIKGWTEAMQLMVEGDKWEMYIPSELGYGDRGSPPKIGGGDVLIFTMEIIKIKGGTKPAITCDPETLDGCNDKEKKFAEKHKANAADKVETELARLNRMKGSLLPMDRSTSESAGS